MKNTILGVVTVASLIAFGIYFYHPMPAQTEITTEASSTSVVAESKEAVKDILQRAGITATDIQAELDTYAAENWDINFLTDGDINGDGKDDYVFYIEDKNNVHKSEFPDDTGRGRKLIMFLSKSDESYTIFTGADLLYKNLECGDCGGVNDPMLNVSISSSTLSIRERGGSPGAWWILGADILYQDGKWIKIKEVNEEDTGTY